MSSCIRSSFVFSGFSFLSLIDDNILDNSRHMQKGEHLLIPSSAVYDTGVTQYVFVETAPGHFVPQRIELGPHVNGDQVVVNQGLTQNEKIVTDGNFLLDSESQLRAASVNGGN